MGLLVLVGGLALVLAGAEPAIRLSGPVQITAGDAWALDIEMLPGEAGDQIDVLLLNGLRQYGTTLTLGSGGVARWSFPEGELLAAGESLVIARTGEVEARWSLTVLPAAPGALDLLTTANTLVAYGEQRGMVIAVASDVWGNPVGVDVPVRLETQFPDGRRQIQMLPLDGPGLAWTWLASAGPPGRLRASASLAGVGAGLEIMQMPGAAGSIDLAVAPPCLPATDGRDLITLVAEVLDEYGTPVVDGTRVLFEWGGGSLGAAPTVAGRAALTIPAPAETGVKHFRAAATQAEGRATLTITAGVCP